MRTSIRSSARPAVSRVSAATSARASPTVRTLSPTPTSTGQSCTMTPWLCSPGMSGDTSTAATPGKALARLTSTLRTRPDGTSARFTLAWSIPGKKDHPCTAPCP